MLIMILVFWGHELARHNSRESQFKAVYDTQIF